MAGLDLLELLARIHSRLEVSSSERLLDIAETSTDSRDPNQQYGKLHWNYIGSRSVFDRQGTDQHTSQNFVHGNLCGFIYHVLQIDFILTENSSIIFILCHFRGLVSGDFFVGR